MTAQNNSGMLFKVLGLVVKAGEHIKNSLGGCFVTNYKSCPSDLVTEVDKEAQRIITEGLVNYFPKHVIVAEEQENSTFRPDPEKPTWYIDPLDGTTNFVFGLPFCCVSVAMAMHGEIQLGIVHDPFRNETFTALKGRGAFLNGRPIMIESNRRTLAESLLVTGFPANKTFNSEMAEVNIKGLLDCCLNLRALGSAALELAYVAAGRFTGFWEVKLRPWDVAAGWLLVEEAGGMVTDLQGQVLQLDQLVSIMATNGHIHSEMVKCMNV